MRLKTIPQRNLGWNDAVGALHDVLGCARKKEFKRGIKVWYFWFESLVLLRFNAEKPMLP